MPRSSLPGAARNSMLAASTGYVRSRSISEHWSPPQHFSMYLNVRCSTRTLEMRTSHTVNDSPLARTNTSRSMCLSDDDLWPAPHVRRRQSAWGAGGWEPPLVQLRENL